jgi:hypothetical protein
MVAPSAQPVEPEDETNPVAPGDLLHRAGEIARRRVDAVRPAAGKEPDPMRRAGSKVGPDDVVVEVSADRVSLRLQVVEEPLAAEQPLLLSRHRREEQRRP